MTETLKVGAVQMATSSDVSENSRKLHDAIDAAGQKDVRVLVTPECALSGYLPDPVLEENVLTPAKQDLAAHAAEHNMWLALGCPTLSSGKWFNTALLFTPEGRLQATYAKTELMPGDHAVFEEGNDLPVFELDGWTASMQICFDMRFPENWRIIRRKGGEVVLHLSSAAGSASWKLPVLEGTVRCRAAENGNFIVSANDAREPQMMISSICDPLGQHMDSAPPNEEVLLTATLERGAIRDDYLNRRRTDLWNSPEHRKLLLD